MAEGQEPLQRAEGGPIAQALGPGAIANALAIEYAHVRPVDIDPTALAGAVRLLGELPLERVPDPGGIPSGSRRPPMPPNRLLAGRDEDLKALAVRIKDDAGGPPTVVVSGIGGVGKTQMAAEFAHRYGRFFAGGVCWLNLAGPASIRDEVAACGGTGGMDLRPDFHTLPLDDRMAAVLGEWQGDLPRLLILDDCADGPTLAGVRPSAGGCRVLATSRGPISDPALGIETFELEPLGRGASVELLRAYHGGGGEAILGEIAAELGDLPLALDLAGRYLRSYRHDTGADEYLEELRSEDVLGHPSLREPDEREVSPTGHDMNVARTFVVSFRRLNDGDETDRLAIRLLARAARFAPGEPIDRRLLLSTVDATEEGPTTRQLHARERALQRLVGLGLMNESEAGPVRVHKLVAGFARLEVEDHGSQADVERAAAFHALQAVRPRQPVRLEPLMPHLRQAIDSALARGEEPAYPARFAMGHALLARGQPAEAVPHLRSSVEYNTARLGYTDWKTMRQRNDMAAAMRRAGDFDGALGVFEPLLEDRRNHLPQPHEDVASTLLNIGATKKDQGLLHEVGPLYEEALGAGDDSIIDELVSENFRDTTSGARGRLGMGRLIGDLRASYPDLEVSVEDQEAEGNLVRTRLMLSGTDRGRGVMWYPPTGRRVVFSAAFEDRFSGGWLVEHGGGADTEGLLRQLGHHEEDGPSDR